MLIFLKHVGNCLILYNQYSSLHPCRYGYIVSDNHQFLYCVISCYFVTKVLCVIINFLKTMHRILYTLNTMSPRCKLEIIRVCISIIQTEYNVHRTYCIGYTIPIHFTVKPHLLYRRNYTRWDIYYWFSVLQETQSWAWPWNRQ